MTTKKLFQIKCWWNDKVLFEGQYVSQKECVEDAVKNGASLDGASLDGASLDGASLDGASLDGARLDGASLVRASLVRASLDGFKQDLIAEILKLPDELENLRDTIIAGKIDGSTYQGECACLAGTIAKHRGISDIMGEAGGKIQENGCVFKADSSSPREVWFMAIRPGQTPENHQPAKLALDWINEAIAIRDHIRKGVSA